MIFDRFLAQAAELLAKGEPFVTVQVVRFEVPISGKRGDKAIIFQDGRIWGWIGEKEPYRKGGQRIHPGLESCKRHREVPPEA